MGATPVAYIDETGCHVPAFADEKGYFETVYRDLYGQDINLDNATQDGQWIRVLAMALHDVNSGILAAVNAYDPGSAVGVGLSRIVKLNSIARAVSGYSMVDMTLVGQAGTVIEAGSLIDDQAGYAWAVPAAIIPEAGQIIATAICTTPGAIEAAPNTITGIRAPSRGWQAAYNAGAATPGGPVETDALLRRRQQVSTAIPARGLTEATAGAILAISGVTRVMAYENDSDVIDDNGLPAHSVAFVVTGGDAATIADVIRRKKGGGSTTYGTTTITTTDAVGIPKPISFFRPVDVPVAVYLSLEALRGFTSDVQSAIARSVAAWINAQGEGAELVRTRAIVPATFNGGFPSNTYKVIDLQMSRDGQDASQTDISMAFYEQPLCSVESVQFYFPNDGG